MRDFTSLPHTKLPYGSLWNGQNGNYSPESFRLPVDTIILHTSVGTLPGTAAWFNNPKSKVSANYGIAENEIVSWVPENYVSFHSGDWTTNTKSIGIEHIDNNNPQAPRSDELINTSAALVADICKFYNIPCNREHIKPHSEIKPTACPGNLPIDEIIKRANAILNPVSEMHTYQLPEKVFVDMVTKGTNLDNLLTALQLSPSLGAEADSYKQVLAYIQNFITAEVSKRAPALATPEVLPVPEKPNGTSSRSKSIWKKDVSDILNNIWNAVRGKSA